MARVAGKQYKVRSSGAVAWHRVAGNFEDGSIAVSFSKGEFDSIARRFRTAMVGGRVASILRTKIEQLFGVTIPEENWQCQERTVTVWEKRRPG